MMRLNVCRPEGLLHPRAVPQRLKPEYEGAGYMQA